MPLARAGVLNGSGDCAYVSVATALHEANPGKGKSTTTSADLQPRGRAQAQLRLLAAKEVEKHLKALLQSALSKLDVVSRDEFETQQAVLMRTRERLEALEKRVSELEAKTQ